MFIKDILSNKKLTLSFEIFPPKKDKSLDGMYRTIEELKELNPDFISVTYGAGGSSKDRTIKLVSDIKNKFDIESVVHLTCITSTREEIKNILGELKNNNINNILALRGDIPKNFIAKDNLDYKNSKDLICELKERRDFCISAAVYPEGHLEYKDIDGEIKHLKEKVDCGAEVLITQLFFDNNKFYEFKEKLYKYNINVPIIVGIMPAVDKALIDRIALLSGANIPDKIKRIMYKYENSKEALAEAGIAYATEQISDLVASGIQGIHLYSMNKPDIARRIVKNIEGIRKAVNTT